MQTTVTSSALLTVTHARIRAAQGDVEGARRLVRAILQRTPDHAEALDLEAELAARRHRPPRPEGDEPLEEVRRAGAAELTERFRRELGRPSARPRSRRLRDWLSKISGPAAPRR